MITGGGQNPLGKFSHLYILSLDTDSLHSWHLRYGSRSRCCFPGCYSRWALRDSFGRVQLGPFSGRFEVVEAAPLVSLYRSSFVRTPSLTSSLQAGYWMPPQTVLTPSRPARRSSMMYSSSGQMPGYIRSSSWATPLRHS